MKIKKSFYTAFPLILFLIVGGCEKPENLESKNAMPVFSIEELAPIAKIDELKNITYLISMDERISLLMSISGSKGKLEHCALVETEKNELILVAQGNDIETGTSINILIKTKTKSGVVYLERNWAQCKGNPCTCCSFNSDYTGCNCCDSSPGAKCNYSSGEGPRPPN